jgi:hypothetical protein
VPRLIVLPLILLSLGFAACGESASDNADNGSASEHRDQLAREVEAEELEAELAEEAAERRQRQHTPAPAAATSQDPMKVAQEAAREVCSASGQAAIAREFGAPPTDPAAAAKAYAEEVSRPAFEPASERGCLEGLSE